MTKDQIKEKIEELDNDLSKIDEKLNFIDSDDVNVHELYQKEAELIEKKFLLIQQYEDLIHY